MLTLTVVPEFKELMAKADFRGSQKELVKMFKLFDTDGTGQLDQSEIKVILEIFLEVTTRDSVTLRRLIPRDGRRKKACLTAM